MGKTGSTGLLRVSVLGPVATLAVLLTASPVRGDLE